MAKAGYGSVPQLLGWDTGQPLSIDQQAVLRAMYFWEVAQDVYRGIWDDREDKRIAALRKS